MQRDGSPWWNAPMNRARWDARARRAALAVALLIALAVPVAVQAKDGSVSPAEVKALGETSAEIGAYALWCAQNGAKVEGTAALAEAKALAEGPTVLGEASKALESLAEQAPTGKEAADKQRRQVGPKVAKLYERLVVLDHDAKDAARFDGYLLGALSWDPSKPRISKVTKAIEDAIKSNRGDAAGRMIVALRNADAEGTAAGRLEKLEIELATKDLLLVGASDPPLVAFVSLPAGWTPGHSYPVLVGVEGAGCSFAGYARQSKSARGSRSVILVTPCGFTNANELKPESYPWYSAAVLSAWGSQPKRMEFDGPGMEKILEAVHTRFGGEDRVFVTGFSGGGNYCYWKLMSDSAHVRGAAPACANYQGWGLDAAPAAASGGPPVRLMTGSSDPYKDAIGGKPPGIEGQTDAAQAKLKELGFAHVERVQLKAAHSPLHAEVWKFVDEVLGAK